MFASCFLFCFHFFDILMNDTFIRYWILLLCWYWQSSKPAHSLCSPSIFFSSYIGNQYTLKCDINEFMSLLAYTWMVIDKIIVFQWIYLLPSKDKFHIILMQNKVIFSPFFFIRYIKCRQSQIAKDIQFRINIHDTI